MLKEHGTYIISDPSRDRPVVEFSTLQCVHCGSHFPVDMPGLTASLMDLAVAIAEQLKREKRGFCQRCNGPVCGRGCEECVPEELMHENIIKGRDRKYVPVSVPVIFDGDNA